MQVSVAVAFEFEVFGFPFAFWSAGLDGVDQGGDVAGLCEFGAVQVMKYFVSFV